ncbi:MAG: hypothetical protein IPJ26_17560 [Bacteroidetes bacterium]|nr:hypothetical protein [Bacteroidota bacterium]
MFGLEGLTRSGSISRGISIGNNQDAVVNSSLNLQIAGKIAGNIEILAAITDENIPVQADGNTQQLQELINKDMRIVIEFQYADRNYARTLLTGFTAVKSEKMQAGINLYSEQDSKNQPLQQDLTPEDKAILAAAGDSLQLAFSTSGDSVAFNVNETLYARIDTTVNSILYPGVYLYTSNPDSAHYQFRLVMLERVMEIISLWMVLQTVEFING